ncbi:MAG TPA: 3-dehydroquinate synthase [Pseudogracilibacillus sp.]|nr:3-dehydroquinate synthase [Pseudogracilibacillus sp.]
MKELFIQTSTHDYTVYVGKGLRYKLNELLPRDYRDILIITDDVVAPLYLEDFKATLKAPSVTVFEVIIPSGERSKSIEQYYRLQTKALEYNLDRNSLIVALGGGVVGDLAGFVAATFMRGIDYVQVPTTILAHDSSVGGKVAINHELGKNLIGAFYPPRAVIYDIDTLKSLPEHEVRSGYAEIVKEAFIQEEVFLSELLSKNLNNISEQELIAHLYKGIKVKATIVEQDETEADIRKFLNFGHTLAHAIEAKLSYGRITHGEAVAIGMLFALKISESYSDTDLQIDKYKQWLKMNDYPLTLFDLESNSLIETMKLDKKATADSIQLVLLEKLGKPIVVDFSEMKLKTYLDAFIKELSET